MPHRFQSRTWGNELYTLVYSCHIVKMKDYAHQLILQLITCGFKFGPLLEEIIVIVSLFMICEIQCCSFYTDLLQLENPFLKMGEYTMVVSHLNEMLRHLLL